MKIHIIQILRNLDSFLILATNKILNSKSFLQYLFISSSILFSYGLKSQSVQTVRGTVVDADLGFGIPGAHIRLLRANAEDFSQAVVSDVDGRFVMTDVPLGRQSFSCSFMGYQEKIIKDVLIIKGKEGVIDFRLEEKINTLDEIVVTDRQKGDAINEMAVVSVNTLETSEIMRFSGTLGDVSRMAQNYAGVSGASDDRNDVIVRGNSPASVLWRLEGVDIPSPNHWSTLGSSGGPISMLNTNVLRSSDFITGAFPAEYGNATGAVFDINLRNGNSDKYEFLGQVGFNGLEAGIEGPIKGIGKHSSFIANYRYSLLGMVNALGIDFGTGTAVPKYQDLSFKLNIPTENAGKFVLWGLAGKSQIAFEDDGEDDLYAGDNEEINSGSQTGMIGFSHQYFFNNSFSSKLSLLYSKTQDRSTIDRITPQDTSQYKLYVDNNGEQMKSTINWTLTNKLNPKNVIKAGVNVDFYSIGIIDSFLIDYSFYTIDRDYDGSTILYRGFGEWEHRFTDAWRLNMGLNVLYFGLNSSTSLEPRLSLAYDLDDKSTIAVAYGRHAQMQPLPLYFNEDRDATPAENRMNQELDFYKSDHFVLSYNTRIASRIKLKLETYYQILSDVAIDPKNPTFSVLNSGSSFSTPYNVGLVNEGSGHNYGLEMTLQQNLNKGFYFMLTSSLFQSKYKGYDEIERNTAFNTNYVANLLLGKELRIGRELYLLLDGKLTVSGGRRFIPIDLDASINAGETVYDYDEAFKKRHPDYIRPDFKLGVKKNGKKVTQTFTVDFQNFINRKNLFQEYYNEYQGKITTIYQRGFFPDVRYQILF